MLVDLGSSEDSRVPLHGRPELLFVVVVIRVATVGARPVRGCGGATHFLVDKASRLHVSLSQLGNGQNEYQSLLLTLEVVRQVDLFASHRKHLQLGARVRHIGSVVGYRYEGGGSRSTAISVHIDTQRHGQVLSLVGHGEVEAGEGEASLGLELFLSVHTGKLCALVVCTGNVHAGHLVGRIFLVEDGSALLTSGKVASGLSPAVELARHHGAEIVIREHTRAVKSNIELVAVVLGEGGIVHSGGG
mmetsp:Transcript_27789/g.61396  ORF Transcript_27789/g.61396 Transcript_27789/m.61396 type:complete len:246 (-) Transcript_27789:1711-2448(-)